MRRIEKGGAVRICHKKHTHRDTRFRCHDNKIPAPNSVAGLSVVDAAGGAKPPAANSGVPLVKPEPRWGAFT